MPRFDPSSFDRDQVRILTAEDAESAGRPSRGDIWWSASKFDGLAGYDGVDRLPFLILDESEAADRRWVDAAPLWHDVEVANDLDLLLGEECTSLEMPLRLQLRREITLAFEQFDEKLGEVEERGLAMIEEAKAGELGLEHFGHAYEGPNDWRLESDRWIAGLISTLEAPYFAALASAEAAVQVAPEAALAEVAPLFILFEAKMRDHAADHPHEYALAAASAGTQRKVELRALDYELFALLWANARKGVLELEIQRVADNFLGALQLIVGLKSGESVSSDPFVPASHTTVHFAEDRALTLGSLDLAKVKALVLSE